MLFAEAEYNAAAQTTSVDKIAILAKIFRE